MKKLREKQFSILWLVKTTKGVQGHRAGGLGGSGIQIWDGTFGTRKVFKMVPGKETINKRNINIAGNW